MTIRSQRLQRGLYRCFLVMYPPSFRREYGELMTQAFCDRLTDRGGIRTWRLMISDLSLSIPQQILEATMLTEKWMGPLASVGVLMFIAAAIFGAGSGYAVVGMSAGVLLLVAAVLSLRAAKKAGRPTEFAVEGSPLRRWTWWTVLAALMATAYVVAATGQLISSPKGTNAGALGIAIGFAALIAIGLRLRSLSRLSGNWLVVVAMAPALAFFWVIVPAVIALAVIIGAVAETSRATPKAPQTA